MLLFTHRNYYNCGWAFCVRIQLRGVGRQGRCRWLYPACSLHIVPLMTTCRLHRIVTRASASLRRISAMRTLNTSCSVEKTHQPRGDEMRKVIHKQKELMHYVDWIMVITSSSLTTCINTPRRHSYSRPTDRCIVFCRWDRIHARVLWCSRVLLLLLVCFGVRLTQWCVAV